MSKYIPNAFQVPNAVIDEYMANLSGTAFKCYMLITRKTTGWQKELDYIPVAQFLSLCGVKKPETIATALNELEKIGLIVRVQSRGKVTGYKLNLSMETTPENGGHPKNGTTPENGGYLPPKMGGTTTPENGGASKPTTKPINTKPNIIKEKYKKEKNKGVSVQMLVDDYRLPEQLAEDWMIVRAGKKARDLTKTAMNSVIKEAEKANLSLERAITIAIERNWIGFKAEWLQVNFGQAKPYAGKSNDTLSELMGCGI